VPVKGITLFTGCRGIMFVATFISKEFGEISSRYATGAGDHVVVAGAMNRGSTVWAEHMGGVRIDF